MSADSVVLSNTSLLCCAGLLVVAKDAESLWKLAEQFKAHTVWFSLRRYQLLIQPCEICCVVLSQKLGIRWGASALDRHPYLGNIPNCC